MLSVSSVACTSAPAATTSAPAGRASCVVATARCCATIDAVDVAAVRRSPAAAADDAADDDRADRGRPTQPAAPPEIELTIEDVRRLALQNNLDLRVELFNPTIARDDAQRGGGPVRSRCSPPTSTTPSSTPPTASRLDSLAGRRASQPTSASTCRCSTGGTMQLGVPVNRFETNNEFSLAQPRLQSDFAASISQPLLRGAGTGRRTPTRSASRSTIPGDARRGRSWR